MLACASPGMACMRVCHARVYMMACVHCEPNPAAGALMPQGVQVKIG